VLTHFSQRYPRLPGGYPATAQPWRRRPLLAVDGAVLSFELLPDLPALMPAVAAALEDQAAEAEGPPGDAEEQDAAPAAADGGGDDDGQLLTGLVADDGGHAGGGSGGCR
jgi:hypothetical protein